MPEDFSAGLILVVKAALAPLQAELAAVKARLHSLEEVSKDITPIRERLAVAEVQRVVPGPAGKDGVDGTDGLGFDDLAVTYDGDRTITLAFSHGTKTRTFPIQLPFLHYQGTYQDSKLYAPGDVVTWGGSAWHCNVVTSLKPGDSADWTMMVKRGDKPSMLPRDSYPAVVKTS